MVRAPAPRMGRAKSLLQRRPARTRSLVCPPSPCRCTLAFPRRHEIMSGMKLLDYWSPPDGSGAPVACFATSFTFEADFFTQDCLARFLSLSTVQGEGDRIDSIVAVLEEEDKLSETQVSVLVDRSSPAEKRN